MNAREPWMQVAHERACDLCTAGVTVDGARRCGDPRVVPIEGIMPPVCLARSRTGACGPEAKYLDFPGLAVL